MDPPLSPHIDLWLPSFTSFSIYYSESLPRGFRVVTWLLSTFVAVPLFGCLTVQLYTPNPLTLSHRIQLHLIKYNWSTDWLIHYLQQIDATKLHSLTSLYNSLIGASDFNWLLEYFIPTLSSNFHLTFILWFTLQLNTLRCTSYSLLTNWTPTHVCIHIVGEGLIWP
jgi:hypothetical protein